MAKNRNRNRQSARPPQPRAAQSTRTARKENAIDKAQAQAVAADPSDVEQAAATEGLELPEIARSSPDAEDPLLSAYDALRAQRAVYEQCRDRADEREREAKAALERVESEARAVEVDRSEITKARSELQALQTRMASESEKLRERETALRELEVRASTGFQDLLALKEQAIEDRLKTVYEQRNAVVEQRQRQLDEEQERLGQEDADLRAEKIKLLRRAREIEAEVEARGAEKIQELESRARIEAGRAQIAETEIERMEAQLAETRAKWAVAGNRDPKYLLEELERLREANRDLEDRLADSLDENERDRLNLLERQTHELREDREQLRHELDEMESRAVYDQASHLKARQLQEVQRHYDLVVIGYQQQLGTLKDNYEKLIASRAENSAAAVFPACVAIDGDDEYAFSVHEDGSAIDLRQFSRSLQSQMWQNEERAYRIDDVCAFLAGLAMSRLHLLEGMSGIGKTSLPKAFARVLQAPCEIIEVQAGWRDQHDLFGHYNSFDKRFHESPFLTALYKAGTPRYRNRPFFIVLDEMNLSRPEQYFSVLLSRLESEDESPIRLAPAAGAGPMPGRFKLDGTGIEIPPNVWFIGTANQDESTLEFADKTYNRAFLLELPPERPWVPNGGEVEPYTHDALRRAFARAEREHRGDVETVKNLLGELREDLHETGRVQVGPRLESQMEKFLPVFIAARGTDPEPRGGANATDDLCNPAALAADQFIASKVLRQIRSRFEVTTEGIEQLEQVLETYWLGHFPGTRPERSMQVLADERRRRSA